MKPRSAIKSDLFAAESRAPKIDSLGDPLVKISRVVDFAALASEGDRVAPRVVSAVGGRPVFPTKTILLVLVLKSFWLNLWDVYPERHPVKSD